MPATLEDAIILATDAHKGQKDKAGLPYILHPIRIMLKMNSEVEKIAAMLHDVVEDTTYTLDDLRKKGFTDVVIEALDRLTRRPDEPYEVFIARVAENPVARKVKIADLEDNMDMKRIDTISKKDLVRTERYHWAWVELRTGVLSSEL